MLPKLIPFALHAAPNSYNWSCTRLSTNPNLTFRKLLPNKLLPHLGRPWTNPTLLTVWNYNCYGQSPFWGRVVLGPGKAFLNVCWSILPKYFLDIVNYNQNSGQSIIPCPEILAEYTLRRFDLEQPFLIHTLRCLLFLKFIWNYRRSYTLCGGRHIVPECRISEKRLVALEKWSA